MIPEAVPCADTTRTFCGDEREMYPEEEIRVKEIKDISIFTYLFHRLHCLGLGGTHDSGQFVRDEIPVLS